MLAAHRAEKHYTYTDYLKFPDDERWELIDGVAYSLMPSPGIVHQALSAELSRQIANQLWDKPCRVFAAPVDVRFELSDRTDKVVQPDLVVVCDPAKITPQGIVGAPDWIVEVLSPSTAGKDQIIKRALYEQQGVREYWLVHPVDKILTIYRLNAEGLYGAPDIHTLTDKHAVSVVPGLEVDWDLWKSPFPDA